MTSSTPVRCGVLTRLSTRSPPHRLARSTTSRPSSASGANASSTSAEAKVEVYRRFFERAASWLAPDGRLGLQLICLDNVGHEGSRPGRGPVTDVILDDIFPEAMSPSFSELAMGWETWFRLDTF